jgi:DNA polymerase-1
MCSSLSSKAFRSGKDFHKYVASLVYGIPVDDITSDQRSHVKAMSYGLAYGLSTYGLAQQLKIKPKEAESLKNQYFATFGKVHEYLESLVSSAREKGYTETIFGRRRYFPGLKSPNRAVRDAAERAALNAPIQGSAADIMKIAMIRAYDALQEANLGSRLILQIHDELVVEIAPGEEKQATALVKDAMEHAVTMAVPLDVSTGIGSDWQLAAH